MAKNGMELFKHELKDMYDAEKKLVRATSSMGKKVKDPRLAQAFEEHSKVTEQQVARLEEVFAQLEMKPSREPCKGINGLIEEFTSFVKEQKPSPDVLNSFAIGAASKVEHYEIEGYKSLIELANLTGYADAASLFELSLAEEQETAEKLQMMSGGFVKQLAIS